MTRNECVYNKKIQSPRQIFQIALVLYQEYNWALKQNLTNQSESDQRANHNQHHITKKVIWVKWIPPPPLWLKINSDGASKGKPGGPPETAGAGWICRNAQGRVVMATPLGITTPLVAETWAFLLAIKMAVSQHWTNIVFETDSKSLMQLPQKENEMMP